MLEREREKGGETESEGLVASLEDYFRGSGRNLKGKFEKFPLNRVIQET